MAEAKLGPLFIHKWIGQRPDIFRKEAVSFHRQGSGLSGSVVMPATGRPYDVTTLTFAPDAPSALAGIAACEAFVGTVQTLLWNGLNFQVVVESYEPLVTKKVALAMGSGPHGPNYNFAPAIEVRINWRLRPT